MIWKMWTTLRIQPIKTMSKGVTNYENQWIDGIRESSLWNLPSVINTLFTQTRSDHHKNLNASGHFKHDLAENFLWEAERVEKINFRWCT